MKRNIHISTLALALSALVGNLSSTTPAKADSWTNTSAMTIPRRQHTATLLPNGKVLVAGGDNVASTFSSAELYDPIIGTWTATGPMATPRSTHTATLLANGKVLVAGGFNGSYLSSAELFDPETGTWTPTGDLNTAHRGATATLLPGGKVLVVGGYYNSTAELYDPATKVWTLTSNSLSVVRLASTVTLLPNGKVLVAGGAAGGSEYSSAELFDPTTCMWTPTGAMHSARRYATATLLPNGKVLVAGGGHSGFLSSAELYDPATETWTLTGALNTGRYVHMAALLPDGRGLIAGGYGANGYLSSAELYDPATEAWVTTGSMSTTRAYCPAVVLGAGKVLFAGGWNETTLASAELYDSLVPLRITVQPKSQIAYWGSTVSFSITVTGGIPPYAYQWLKDAAPVTGATNALLVMTNLQATNAGVYTVVVSDTVTNLTSLSANLTVNPAGVAIALYAGVTIDGVVGQTYGVQSTLDLSITNSWAGRANVTLTNATQLWYDSQPATQPQTYYRVVPGPISIP
jgi:WD40 repeat protein